MIVSPDEKAVLDALRQVECAPFTEFSRICLRADRYEKLVQEAYEYLKYETSPWALSLLPKLKAALAGEDA